MTNGTPSPVDRPRRRNDRLRAVLAGAIAVLAVLAGIFLVNLLNDPSDGNAATATDVAASAASAASAAAPSAPAAAPTTSELAEEPRSSAPPSKPTTSAPATGTTPAPAPAPPSAPPSPTSPRVFTTVTIFNDSRIPGLAQEAIAPVEAAGFTVDRVGNFTSVYNTPVTTVFYDPEDEAAARTMVDTVAGVGRMAPRSETNIQETGTLILVVTKDFPVN